MLGKVPASRLRLIEDIVRAARARTKGAAHRSTDAFVRRYFRGVAEEELRARGAAALAGAALCHLAAGATRRPGRPLVHVFNPEAERDGFTSEHTVVTIVCEDMPFLVDSIGIAANQEGLSVHPTRRYASHSATSAAMTSTNSGQPSPPWTTPDPPLSSPTP